MITPDRVSEIIEKKRLMFNLCSTICVGHNFYVLLDLLCPIGLASCATVPAMIELRNYGSFIVRPCF
jgi:hypothetical protein